MSVLLIEPHYLPCIEYFTMLSSADQVVLECQENYQKQSYRNRCRILTAQGPLELSIPVLKPRRKMLLKDVKIDYQQKWVKDHWRTIQTAYGNAPFYQHFAPFFYRIYQRKPSFLLDLNFEFISLIQKLLSNKTPISKTTGYCKYYPETYRDWRSKIHPKKGLKINPFYKPCNYNQIFGKKFVGNLSIIDLLFCEGPLATDILTNCKS